MASFRSRVHSTPSRNLSKSPSLQNVYTAGMSARQERGVFMNSSLSRTRSTSELHSYSLGNAKKDFTSFKRSERRSTLTVPYSGSGQNRSDKETLMMMKAGNANKLDTRNLGHSQLVRAKSALDLHRQVFEHKSRNFDRPSCLSAPRSAPSSPRHSVDTPQCYVYPASNSAPSSPQGSVNAIHSENGPSLQPMTTNGVFNHPATNPFHEGYQKRWGSVTIDTAYGIYSSHLKQTNDSNNNSTIPGNTGEMADTNRVKSSSGYDIYSKDLNDKAYGSTSCYGPIVSGQPSTYAVANGVYSPVLRQNGDSAIPERAEMLANSSQTSTYPIEMSQQRPQTRHYSIDVSSNNNGMYYNSRNSLNNTSTIRSYASPVTAIQLEEKMDNVNTKISSGIYVPNSPLSPGNMDDMNCLERSFLSQNIPDQCQKHLPLRVNLDTTDGIGSLRSQNTTSPVPSVNSNGSSQPTRSFGLPDDEQFQKQRGSINPETSDGRNSSFFQTFSNNQNFSTEQNSPKETANILFQKYFRSRRGSADSEISGKVSPNSGNNENNPTRTFIDGFSQVPQRQSSDILRAQSYVRQNTHEITTRNSVNRLTNSTIPSEQLPNEYVENKLQHGHSQLGRGGVEGRSDLRNVPQDEARNHCNASIQLRGSPSNFTREKLQERTVSRDSSQIYSSSSPKTTNNLTPPSTPFQKRNSRSPEPVLAVHPFINLPSNPTPNSSEMSALNRSDADELNRFQEQSQRRRSSLDSASLASLPIRTSKSETPSPKTSLSRSQSHSNLGERFNAKAGQVNHRRSALLRPIPSFEEFRTMRALNKKAYFERNDGETSQKDENNDCGENSKDKNDYYRERGYKSCKSNDGDNTTTANNNNNDSNSLSETTTTSPTKNLVIQDLLVKYGLDKSPRSSTIKLQQNSSNRHGNRKSRSPSPSDDNLKTTASDSTDTKQRLLNILDDFLAVRTKQKTLSTTSSMYDLKAVSSLRDQRRPSLPEDNRSSSSHDGPVLESKSLDLKAARDSPNRTDSENYECDFSSVLADPKSRSPTLIISSPNSESYENMNCEDTNTSNQSKIQNNSESIDRRNCSERSRRRSKKTSIVQKGKYEVHESESRAKSPNELKTEISNETSNNGINQSDKSVVSLTSDVKPRERERTRKVSEKARNMARKHRESLELVKKSGKKARTERRRSFTQAMQNKKKGSTSEQDEYTSQENGEKQPVGKSGPVKGDHSVEVESTGVEQGDLKYLRLMNRRTSSLLSLTDDLSGDLDEFDGENAFPNRSESLSEFNEEYSSPDQAICRADSFLGVDTDFPRGRYAFRTESSSSLLSRCSSFHSNFSADSGSVQLDFEDSDEDDDLFFLAEPQETVQKSETEIQRNDSGLGDEIGVGTRAKKRWQDFGHVSSRQSMIVECWREMAARKEDRVQEEQCQVEKEEQQGQQKQGRKISHDRRISRERPPNAVRYFF